MSALIYLSAFRAKNKLIELLHKPLKLVLTLGFVLLLVMNFTVSDNSLAGERPISEFKAIIFAFYALCFVTESKKGLQSGGTMFSMADVNLLFMSPVNSVAVLLHGMLSRLGSSLFMALAFVYQFALLRSYYPLSVADMLTAVAGYAAVIFVSQLAGLLIYFYTCGRPERVRAARAVLYSLCGVFVLLLAERLIGTEHPDITSVASAVTAFPMRFFPVAGWIFTAVEGIMLSDGLKLCSGALACLAFSVIVFLLLAFSKHGYYEDVLLSAEKNSEKKSEQGVPPVGKIRRNAGKLKGGGASAFFYKHLLENRRTKSAVLSPTSVFYLVVIGVYGFIFDGDFVMLFSLSCIVSFLPVLGGGWLRELTMPHIYLVPEKPVKKLFYLLPEMLPKIIAESVLQCALIGYLCGLGPVTALLVTVARISVSFVLIAWALLTARIFREREKNNVFIAMSVLPGMLFLLPSVFACVITLNFFYSFSFAFAVMAGVNCAVSLIILFFARNLLKITE